MAATLIFLLIGYFTKNDICYIIAIPVLIMNMVYPMFYYYLGFVWFGLANILGFVVSKIILSLVFFVVVTPIGLIRKISGKDSLKLKQFKKNDETSFTDRNKTFSAQDIENPY